MILELLQNQGVMSSINGNAFNILETPIVTNGSHWHGIFAIKMTDTMHGFLVIDGRCVTTYVVVDYEHQPPVSFDNEEKFLKLLVTDIVNKTQRSKFI